MNITKDAGLHPTEEQTELRALVRKALADGETEPARAQALLAQ